MNVQRTDNNMSFLTYDQTLYEQLKTIYRGAITKVAESCGIHRHTVRRILSEGTPSEKRVELRKAAEKVIQDYSGTEAAQRTEKEVEAAA